MERDEAIRRIRAALRKRSGKAWSVRGGRGTAWGWIYITSPPARRPGSSIMTDEDRAELARLLGLESVGLQGNSVPASYEYRRAYVDRAETGTTMETPTPYWD